MNDWDDDYVGDMPTLGSIAQLTDHKPRRLPKREPMGFDLTAKGDKPMKQPDNNRTIRLAEVEKELKRADMWPGFNSAHEGFAVLKEEVDELWDQVKVNQKKRDLDEMRNEAIQVAAMALKFLEMIDEGRGRV